MTSFREKPLVSVVTPFYNTVDYLGACIESVLGQSYINFEYILLDNCSTDGSAALAKEYAARDNRIALHTNSSLLGQVKNYNHALSLISQSSRYCKMVQADDMIFPECLALMVDLAEEHPTIGLVSSYRLKGIQLAGGGLELSETFISGRSLCRRELREELYLFGSPTTVLYRSDIVRSRIQFFHENKYHEDTEVCFEILKSADFGFVHQVLSFTRTENESITGSAYKHNPGALDVYLRFQVFGKEFLEGAELEACGSTVRRSYYLFLARNVVRGSGLGFWKYHRAGLQSAGQDISWSALVGYVLLVLLDSLLNPKRTGGRIVSRMKGLRRTK